MAVAEAEIEAGDVSVKLVVSRQTDKARIAVFGRLRAPKRIPYLAAF
jgi:hypothetical protein